MDLHPKPIQCYKCNKIGHTKQHCKEVNPSCALCAKDHEMSPCPKNTTNKCINCNGNHPALSKKRHYLNPSNSGNKVSNYINHS